MKFSKGNTKALVVVVGDGNRSTNGLQRNAKELPPTLTKSSLTAAKSLSKLVKINDI